MVLPTPGGPIKQHVGGVVEEPQRAELGHQLLVDRGLGSEVEVVERPRGGQTGEALQAGPRRISVALTSTSRRRCQELGVAELVLRGHGRARRAAPRRRHRDADRPGASGSLDRSRTRSSSLRDLAIDGEVDDGLTADGPEEASRFFEGLSARRTVRLLVTRTGRGEGARARRPRALHGARHCAPGRPNRPERGGG